MHMSKYIHSFILFLPASLRFSLIFHAAPRQVLSRLPACLLHCLPACLPACLFLSSLTNLREESEARGLVVRPPLTLGRSPRALVQRSVQQLPQRREAQPQLGHPALADKEERGERRHAQLQ